MALEAATLLALLCVNIVRSATGRRLDEVFWGAVSGFLTGVVIWGPVGGVIFMVLGIAAGAQVLKRRNRGQ
jgi:hypothetical protein